MAGNNTPDILEDLVMACATISNRRAVVARDPAGRAYAEEAMNFKHPATIEALCQATESIGDKLLTPLDRTYMNKLWQSSRVQNDKELLEVLESAAKLVKADRLVEWNKVAGIILLVSQLVGESISCGLRNRVTILLGWIKTLFNQNQPIAGESIMTWISKNGGFNQLLSVASQIQGRPTVRMLSSNLPPGYVPFKPVLGVSAPMAAMPTPRTRLVSADYEVLYSSTFNSGGYEKLVGICSCKTNIAKTTPKQQTLAKCPQCERIWCMMSNCDDEFPSADHCLDHQEQEHGTDNRRVENGRPYNIASNGYSCNCTGAIIPVFANNTTQGRCKFCKSTWCLVPSCRAKFKDLQACSIHQSSFHTPEERNRRANAAPSICSGCGAPRPPYILELQFDKDVVHSECQICHTIWCLIDRCTGEFHILESFRDHERRIHRQK